MNEDLPPLPKGATLEQSPPLPRGATMEAAPAKPREKAGIADIFPTVIPDIDVPEIGRGAYYGGQRMVGALGQFVPSQRERATELAREAQRKIEATPEAATGAFLSDVLGLGALTRPLQAATATGRLLKTGAAGAGYTAATTPALAEDETFARQKLIQSAIGFGAGAAPQALKEGVARLIPGALNVATPEAKNLLLEAKRRGYTIPISEMTDNAFLSSLDRVFQNPLMARNAPLVNRELNRAMGQTGDSIDLGKAATNLGKEVKGLLQGKTVKLDSLSSGAQQILQDTFAAIPALEKRPLQKLVASAQQMGMAKASISGTEWHEARQLLNKQYQAALRSATPDVKQVNALRNLINEWDDAAYNSIKDKTFEPAFEAWKQKWTAFSDISEAANKNENARKLMLRGMVDPADLMNTIAQRRQSEFQERTFAQTAARGQRGGRPQTATAATAGGLDVFGREPTAVAPWLRGAGVLGLLSSPFTGGTTASVPLGLGLGKGLQSYLYSPRGQELLMRGYQPRPSVTTFVAPVAGAKQMLPGEGE